MFTITEKTKARAAVLLGNFFFGTSVIAVKHISPSLMPPLALTTVRICSAVVLFWSMYALNPVPTGIVKKDYLLLFLCALAGISMNQTFSVLGMAFTSPIHASLLILTTPITITILAAVFLGERMTVLKVLGLLLGISGGVVLVFARDISGSAGNSQALGDMFVVLGALSYSSYVISIKPLMQKYKANHILQWVFLFGMLATVPVGWHDVQKVSWASFDALSWFCLVYVVLGGTFFAYRLMNYSIKKLGAAVTGSYIYTQPFFTTVASMLLLHETLSLPKIMAAALIMGGVFLANYKRAS